MENIEKMLKSVDWALLAKQKLSLIGSPDNSRSENISIPQDVADGLLHFIDAIQDAAVLDRLIPESDVFTNSGNDQILNAKDGVTIMKFNIEFGKAETEWADFCYQERLDQESQIIYLDGLLRKEGLFEKFANHIRRIAAEKAAYATLQYFPRPNPKVDQNPELDQESQIIYLEEFLRKEGLFEKLVDHVNDNVRAAKTPPERG